jgi:hypothetical protein
MLKYPFINFDLFKLSSDVYVSLVKCLDIAAGYAAGLCVPFCQRVPLRRLISETIKLRSCHQP